MKYSLRSLMIVVLVAPPFLAVAIWLLLPHGTRRTPRGTPADMAEFLRVIKEPHSLKTDLAVSRCFVVGAPAGPYSGVLAKADRVKPSEPWQPVGTQHEFWCEGKDYTKEGDYCVVVVVGGTPPTILYAQADGLVK